MLSPINLLIFILWVSSAVVDYSEFCYLWQLKEYRSDRFQDFLHTRQGQLFLRSYALLWRSLLAFIFFFWPFNAVLLVKYIIVVVFTVDLVRTIRKVRVHSIRRPHPTSKALMIIVVSMSIEGGLLVLTRDWSLLFILLVLRFGIITSVVALFRWPTWWLKRLYIKRAEWKMRLYPNMKVVGITGSYGKTTTKEFLYHLLEKKFRVIKTPKNINTEIGVARFILHADFHNKEIFIVEMAAYKRGEIKQICDIVRPRIGILTAINEQHLSLFGDIKNTQAAKYELLRALPSDGLAVVNADNAYCREYLHELTCRVMTFGMNNEHHPALLIDKIVAKEGSLIAGGKMEYQGKEYHGEVNIPIIGEHNVMNLAPAVMVGVELGMERTEIEGQLSTIHLPHGILQTYAYGKTIILDDSYNSNPDGFKAALNVLSTYPSQKKRIVITRGMIELGEKSEEIHERIGGEIAFCADELVIISPDYTAALRRGINHKYKTTILEIYDPEELLSYMHPLKEVDTVVLLENRMPSGILKELRGSIHEEDETL